MENQKIPLYKIRSFGVKVGDTFAFVSENIKPMLKYITYFLLPVSLVMGLSLNGYLNGITAMAMSAQMKNAEPATSDLATFVSSMGGLIIISVLSYPLLTAIVYSLMRLYNDRENGLKDLAWDEMKPTFMRVLGRAFKLMGFGLLLTIVVGLVVAFPVIFLVREIGVAVLVPFYILLIIVVFPLLLMSPIYIFEDEISLIDSLKKSFRLGFGTWGGIFALMLVLSLIVSIISGIVSMPWTIAMVMKMMFTLNEGSDGFTQSVGFNFLTYLFSVLQAFVSYICYAIPLIGLAYQYGHAAEKIDHVTVDSDIEIFETL